MYLAIIGDVINSKRLANRNEMQLKMDKTLQLINKKFKKFVVTPFMITLGDEFQGLCTTDIPFMEVIMFINLEMYPVQIRYGIGIGEIKTRINKKTSFGTDGPAYWAARSAIDFIHKKPLFKECRTFLCIDQNDDTYAANNLIALCDFIETHWTRSQVEFVKSICVDISDGKLKQKEVAEKNGISPQLLNLKIKNTGLTLLLDSHKNIEKSVRKLIKDN